MKNKTEIIINIDVDGCARLIGSVSAKLLVIEKKTHTKTGKNENNIVVGSKPDEIKCGI